MPASKREMTVREAAKLLPGMSETTLKCWLRNAYFMKAAPCPFAVAVVSEAGEWQFYVFPKRLQAYLNAEDLRLSCRESAK